MMKKIFISIFTIWVGVGGIFNLNYLYRQNDVYATEPVAPTDSATDDDPGTPTDDTPTEDEPSIISDQIPELYIKAINPGYTVDKISNVGEMIEIGSRTSDAPISLAGITIGYTNSSGNDSVLLEFPEHTWMSGETLLLRLASSPDSDLANITYTKTLALKGGLTLYRGEEVLDSVCWTGKDDCVKDFKSAKPTVLVRNLTTGDFEHLLVDDYEIKYSPDNYTITSESTSEEEAAPKPSQCRGMVFSEILSYYETLKSEQFIEFHNNSAEQILTDGCQVRYKNKLYTLSGILTADGYVAYYPSDLGFNLTKIPTNVFYEWVLPYFERRDLFDYPLVLSSIGRWHGEEDQVMSVAAGAGHEIKAAVILNISEADVEKRFEEAKILNDRGDRADDGNLEVFRTRLKEFREKTLPVLQHYNELGLLVEVNGDQTREAVFEELIEKLYRRARS